MPERITRRTNPLLQHVRRLQTNRKYRYETESFLADGTKLVREALRWGSVRTVLLREDLDFPVPANVREVRLPEGLLKDLSRMETPQGVLAVCAMPAPSPLELRPGCLILDGVQDPGNLGTILRTAEALGVPVLLSDGCADPYNEKTVRATMGAIFRAPPRQATAEELIAAARAADLPLCVTALSPAAVDLRTLPLERFATVIGSEGRGVGPRFLEAADKLAIIPMNGEAESLNAAISAAIVMWQMQVGRV